MKIKDIKKLKNSVYEVTFAPNWIERLFGLKEVSKQYRQSDSYYSFGGGNVYVKPNGKELGNHNWIGESIDQFKRKW